MSSAPSSAGLSALRPAPPGLPEPTRRPPVVAESDDPFAGIRIVNLLACIERGDPVRLQAVVDRLNATYLDWLFTERVVADAVIQLQANWMADYRNSAGVVLEEGSTGTLLTIEDSPRVDPWIVRQALRLDTECEARLAAFSRRDSLAGEG